MTMELATINGRSDTAYNFHEEEADEILKVASYYHERLRFAVIHFSPACHAPILSSIATPFPLSSRVSGQPPSLDGMPLELSQMVISDLDMYSLFSLRRTTTRLRSAVDSLSQYQLVAAYGLDLFCALLRTQHASNITLPDFHRALCTKNRAFCGSFGGFISLLIWERRCLRCLRDAPQTSVQTLQPARRNFSLNTADAHQPASLKMLTPEHYDTNQELPVLRNFLVSTQHAESAWSARPRRRRREDINQHYLRLNFMGACALPFYDSRTREVESGISCAGCELRAQRYGRQTSRPNIYTRLGFLEHFRQCRHARFLWNLSKEGKELPFKLLDNASVDVERYFIPPISWNPFIEHVARRHSRSCY